MPLGSIDPSARLVLTNAIYFYGAREIPFDGNLTETDQFYPVDDNEVLVPMMSFSPATSRGRTLPAVVLDGYTAVELPYKGGEIAMLILVPDQGRFYEIEQALDANLLDRTVESLTHWSLDLRMPMFKYESEFQLKNSLSQMGMPDAFDQGKADFSGINGTRELYIQEAYHKSFISVNEKGTEAAAATGVVMVGVSAFPSLTVTIDRPFIYFIRDIETNALLFVGRVMNPEK